MDEKRLATLEELARDHDRAITKITVAIERIDDVLSEFKDISREFIKLHSDLHNHEMQRKDSMSMLYERLEMIEDTVGHRDDVGCSVTKVHEEKIKELSNRVSKIEGGLWKVIWGVLATVGAGVLSLVVHTNK